MKYGILTIIDPKEIGRKHQVKCLCECGVEKFISIYCLRNGDTKSCGCLRKNKMIVEAKKRFTGHKPANFTDWSGKRIGMVTVLGRIVDCRLHTTTYLLKCDCGTEFEQEISSIRRAKYKRCECGRQKHPLKSILLHMRDRCENHNNKSFQWYGAKGIKVCEEWKKFPIKFIKWSEENGWTDTKHSPRKQILTIDRIDSSKDYCPENCQWITLSENSSKAMKKRWSK